MINGHLVDMEEAELSPTDDPIQEDRVAVSNPGVTGEDKDEE